MKGKILINTRANQNHSRHDAFDKVHFSSVFDAGQISAISLAPRARIHEILPVRRRIEAAVSVAVVMPVSVA